MICFWIVFDACSWASEEKGDSFDGKHVICIYISGHVVKPRRFLFVILNLHPKHMKYADSWPFYEYIKNTSEP